MANYVFKLAIKTCLEFSSPRAWAYSILGCLYYLNRFSGDTETRSVVEQLGDRLSELYTKHRTSDWYWFEHIITYANARLPHGLIAAGHYLKNRTFLEQGLESLDWLIKIQTAPKSKFLSLIGNAGWYKKGGRKARFDQQSVEAYGLMDASYQAYEATDDDRWRQEAEKAFFWFLGKNDKNESLYDFRTGGCYDGLHRGGINLNEGAESTLSWLAALHLMYRYSHKEAILPQDKQVAGISSKKNRRSVPSRSSTNTSA
jgi:hypothetical protein